MKKNSIKIITLFSFALISAHLISFRMRGNVEIKKYHADQVSYGTGAPTGKTGAPGEGNCTDCHSGIAQDGSNINQISFMTGSTPVSSYTPGQDLDVFVSMNPNPSTKGFEIIALDQAGNMAGSFTAQNANGTKKVIAGSKQYITHINNNVNPGWGWIWTPPLSNVGPVTFYLATNKSNGAGSSGDVIYLSQHQIGPTAASVETLIEKHEFTMGYSNTNNILSIKFISNLSLDMNVNLVDMNGMSVWYKNIGISNSGKNKHEVELPNDLECGIYIANFLLGNNIMSSKIQIVK